MIETNDGFGAALAALLEILESRSGGCRVTVGAALALGDILDKDEPDEEEASVTTVMLHATVAPSFVWFYYD